jgi:phage baseplate assembly protein gpV
MTDTLNPRPDDLWPIERLLLDAVLLGRTRDLDGEVVRAGMIRALVSGERDDWPLPPIGVVVTNAVIQGSLDLEGCVLARPLVFKRCRFAPIEGARAAISLRDAVLKRIAFYECQIAGPLKADRAAIESALFLTGSTIEGLVRLRGASIGEALAMDAVQVRNPGETAVLADGLRLGGPWILRAAEITGEIRFASARIGGGLLWEDARIKNNQVAVAGDGATCDGPWVLRRAVISGACRLRGMSVKAIDAQQLKITSGSEGFNARGAEIGSDLVLDGSVIKGGVLLGRTDVKGELSAKGADIAGVGQDWAIGAAGLIVGQGVALAGARLAGGITLAGARIEQGINASNLRIESSGRAIDADTIHIGGNWIMRGAEIAGNVRFAGAHVAGQIAFTESKLRGGGDLAIRADGATIEGGWFMGRADIQGLVRFPSARLGNEMRLRASRIAVAAGPAVFASGVRIARELVIDGGFTSEGGIVLDRAEIDGTLDLSGSRIRSAALVRGGPAGGETHDPILTERYDASAISLVDARLDRLIMPEHAEDRPVGVVDLSRARVGSYEDSAAAWPPPKRGRRRGDRDLDHLVLDGFIYDHLETPTGLPASEAGSSGKGSNAALMRTRWLEAQSQDDLEQHFKPQAWVHLSRRLAAQGFHDDAREIAIARRRRQRRSASVTRGARLQGWLLDVFALYGYNPWRTVLWMAAFVLLFAGIWWWAAEGCGREDCKDESVFAMALKGNYGQDDRSAEARYPGFSPLAYSLDVFLPFVNLGFKEHWRPRTGYLPFATVPLPAESLHGRAEMTLTLGGVLYVLYVAEMLIGLILASLAVTGFAGLLRSDEEPRQ